MVEGLGYREGIMGLGLGCFGCRVLSSGSLLTASDMALMVSNKEHGALASR